jgi:hypothetical protein
MRNSEMAQLEMGIDKRVELKHFGRDSVWQLSTVSSLGGKAFAGKGSAGHYWTHPNGKSGILGTACHCFISML